MTNKAYMKTFKPTSLLLTAMALSAEDLGSGEWAGDIERMIYLSRLQLLVSLKRTTSELNSFKIISGFYMNSSLINKNLFICVFLLFSSLQLISQELTLDK